MTEKGFRIVSDVNREGWEKSDFPQCCETCMGDNPYVRMMKTDYGNQCMICTRPHTIFRWKAGTKARYKQTIICQTCAKLKNVCQICLFDLEYGLPVQVRDKFLAEHEKVQFPESDVGKQFFLGQAEAGGQNALPYGKEAAHPMLKRLAEQRKGPYYKRNEARICSFFVKGTCNRGDTCPYRHELPEGGELACQKIKDRFHGVDDPVAKKVLRLADERMTLHAPEDKSLTTLYVGGIKDDITEQDIRDKFYLFGEILSIRVVTRQHMAFVTYVSRAAAEAACEQLHRDLNIKGTQLRLNWAKGTQKKGDGAKASASAPAEPAGTVEKPYYPSMDPASVGNAPAQ